MRITAVPLRGPRLSVQQFLGRRRTAVPRGRDAKEPILRIPDHRGPETSRRRCEDRRPRPTTRREHRDHLQLAPEVRRPWGQRSKAPEGARGREPPSQADEGGPGLRDRRAEDDRVKRGASTAASGTSFWISAASEAPHMHEISRLTGLRTPAPRDRTHPLGDSAQSNSPRNSADPQLTYSIHSQAGCKRPEFLVMAGAMNGVASRSPIRASGGRPKTMRARLQPSRSWRRLPEMQHAARRCGYRGGRGISARP